MDSQEETQTEMDIWTGRYVQIFVGRHADRKIERQVGGWM
jgi:hypothetical protein